MKSSNDLRSNADSLEEKKIEPSGFTPLDPLASTFGRLSTKDVMRRGRMGDAYVKSERLTTQEVDTIVQLQDKLKIRFGEAAVILGLLTKDEVREVLDVQFDYASLTPNGRPSKISSSLAIVHSPGGEAAEAIKRLRSELLVRLGQNSSSALAVLSPLKREGKSHIAASLAIAFAQLNIKTMLIDANLRVPVQHKLFSLPNQFGLSTILAKRSKKSLDSIPQVLPNFWVLTSGPLPPNPLEIISAQKLRALIDYFSKDVSVFIVDTPSTMQWADAQVIARQTGYGLFVARQNVTKLADLKNVKKEMESADVEILGTVFNQPDKSRRFFKIKYLSNVIADFLSFWMKSKGSTKGNN
jgi:protein-tyrosine kinase